MMLLEAGSDGIKLNVLVKNVYNVSHTFFCGITYEETYKFVKVYVHKNSKSFDSPIEAMERKGYYRINKAAAVRLHIVFSDDYQPEQNGDDV